jgi:hypothetical protein
MLVVSQRPRQHKKRDTPHDTRTGISVDYWITDAHATRYTGISVDYWITDAHATRYQRSTPVAACHLLHFILVIVLVGPLPRRPLDAPHIFLDPANFLDVSGSLVPRLAEAMGFTGELDVPRLLTRER